MKPFQSLPSSSSRSSAFTYAWTLFSSLSVYFPNQYTFGETLRIAWFLVYVVNQLKTKTPFRLAPTYSSASKSTKIDYLVTSYIDAYIVRLSSTPFARLSAPKTAISLGFNIIIDKHTGKIISARFSRNIEAQSLAMSYKSLEGDRLRARRDERAKTVLRPDATAPRFVHQATRLTKPAVSVSRRLFGD